MPAKNIFDTLRDRVEKSNGLLPYEKRAMYWFKDLNRDLTKWQKKNTGITLTEIRSQHRPIKPRVLQPPHVLPGFLYFYTYNPKLKKTLPYYDRLPLTLVLHIRQKDFLGLNFHYLPYKTRAAFFDLLHDTHMRAFEDPLKTRMTVTYAILKNASKYRAFRPCIKRYLHSHITSGIVQIPETDWDLALFLPCDRFTKAPNTEVWDDATKMIYRYR